MQDPITANALVLGACVWARAAGLVWYGPAWVLPGLTWRMRLILSLMLGMVFAPSATRSTQLDINGVLSFAIAGWLAIEFAIGAALGLVAGLFVAAFRQAGELIGAQAGLGPASLLGADRDADASGELSPFGHVFTMLATVVFLVCEGPLVMADAFGESFAVIPPLLGLEGPRESQELGIESAWWVVAEIFSRVGGAVGLALRCAAPVGVALIAAGIGISLISRGGGERSVGALAWTARWVIGMVLVILFMPALAMFAESAWRESAISIGSLIEFKPHHGAR